MEPGRKCGVATRAEVGIEMKTGQHSFSEKQEVKQYVGSTLNPKVLQTYQHPAPDWLYVRS